MALFESDLEALIYIGIFSLVLLFINNILSFFIRRIENVSMKKKVIVQFFFRILAVMIIVFLIIEGLPAFQSIDPEYTAVITGAISIALAFASSGIFMNLVAGIISVSYTHLTLPTILLV